MRGLTQSPVGPPRNSLFEDLIHWSLQYPWFPHYNNQNASSQSTLVFVQPMLYIACAEWLIMCEYIKTRLGQIEWELGFPTEFRPDPEVIDVSLKRLHPWRRLIPLYRDMLTETMGDVISFASRARNTSGSSGMDNHALPCGCSRTDFGDTNADLENILRQITELQSRTDRLTSVVTATIAMEDARRGLRESGNVRRLTWLAFVFIPLSFLTGLFSMQSDITTLSLTFAWYFAAAVPVTALTLTIALSMSRFRGKEGNVKGTKK
jgi:Mg2+ and Co2+ transporter CorA